MVETVVFEVARRIDPEELLAFYQKQKHDTTHSLEKLRRMVDRTFCLVTARRDDELIGIARGVTDGVRGQLVECKLDPAFQGPGCVTRIDGRIEHDAGGIAREMALQVINALRDYGVQRIDVLAYGTEVDFCEELGFKRSPGVVLLTMGAKEPKTRTRRQAGAEV